MPAEANLNPLATPRMALPLACVIRDGRIALRLEIPRQALPWLWLSMPVIMLAVWFLLPAEVARFRVAILMLMGLMEVVGLVFLYWVVLHPWVLVFDPARQIVSSPGGGWTVRPSALETAEFSAVTLSDSEAGDHTGTVLTLWHDQASLRREVHTSALGGNLRDTFQEFLRHVRQAGNPPLPAEQGEIPRSTGPGNASDP